MQAFCKLRILHNTGLIFLAVLFPREQDLIILDLDLIDLLIVNHRHECAIVHLLDLLLREIWSCHIIEHQDDSQNQDIIKGQ